MKVLRTGSEVQKINIIPRIYSEYIILSIRNESTNEELYYYLLTNTNNDYLEVSNTYDLTEGVFYNVRILDAGQSYVNRVNNNDGTLEVSSCFYEFYKDDNNLIYRDKMFCTDQTVDQSNNEYYDINKGVYIQRESNNDYIILNE